MGAPTPQVLLEAIASAAASGTSPGDKTAPMPDAPPGGNLASIQGGFPANTMESELAGGLPPFGQDMNGYLFLISSHTLYVECGQLYQYSSALATAIGGYLAGSILGMADGTGIWLCTANDNMTDPDTGGAGWVPLATYGKTVVNSLTGGTVALTAAQSKYSVIILNGVLVSPLTIQLPQNDQEWLIVNNTSGAFTTTVLTAAGGSVGVQVPQGGFGAPTGVYSIGDGNIYPTVAAFGFSISVAPTNNSIVQRSNLGYVLATYFNTSAGVDNLTPSTVFTNSGDGFIRQNTLTNFESFLLLQALGGQVSNGQVPYSVVQQWVSTFLNNAALTGTPTAPTAVAGTNNTQIATTAFVQNAAGSSTFSGGNGANTQSSVTFAGLGGLTLKFGQTGFFSGSTDTVTFNAAFANIGYIALAIPINNSADISMQAVPSTTGFEIVGGATGITCLWLAIGR